METPRRNIELWLAFFAILCITFGYLLAVAWLEGIPGASSFLGHGLGILGFILMLMTETLYTLRKRSRSARWGRTSGWLNFHIFTGLVGPYLVLLHSSWKFNGLAGLVTLLTAIIVASGIVGRYIYTSVPRNLEGIVIEKSELESELASLDFELQRWLEAQTEESYRSLAGRLVHQKGTSSSPLIVLGGRFFWDWANRFNWWQMKVRLEPEARTRMARIERIYRRKRQLDQQIHSLAAARRMLALWHAVHIPIGIVLFTAAFIHIIAAVYYTI